MSFVTQVREPFFHRLLRTQPFWVFVAFALLCLVLSLVSSPFATAENFSNVTLNFAFIGIIAQGMTAGISAILMVGWMGSVGNELGKAYELKVIAASVIGGVDLMGGVGSAHGAVVGAALIEVIRNGLLIAGVDPYWQGTYVGGFIVFALLLARFRNRRGTF